MQKLGQHFLKNKNVIAKIIDALAPQAGDAVFEIGPGHGELTFPLVDICSKIGCSFAAIEKDPLLADKLLAGLGTGNLKDIEVQKGDALKLLPSLMSKYKNFPSREDEARPMGGGISRYLLVGNIPYYITGHLLRIISELNDKPERSIFMVQKEVAERIIAQPPAMNRLAASVQFWAEPKIIVNVPKSDFRPEPKIDSAVILLERKKDSALCSADDYYATVRVLFGQPRKTVLNNVLSGVNVKKIGGYTKENAASALKNIGIDPECRPQNLSIRDIAVIAKMFFEQTV